MLLFVCTFLCLFAPVEGELVEPHGAHEGDVGELVVKQLPLLLWRVHHPQSGEFLKDDWLQF